MQKSKTKKNTKDSLFTNLFGIPKYAFELYKSFHPEDTTSTQDDLEIITLENVLVNGGYNDLGILMKDRLMLFIEAQSTWNENMPIRILFYIAETYERFINERNIDLHHSGNIKLPYPEAYVIFTGDRKHKPKTLRLSDHFIQDKKIFKGGKNSLELNVKMIYNSDGKSIVNQYIEFCKIFDSQKQNFPDDRDKVIIETFRICREKKLLSDYLKDREYEVRKLMTGFIWDEERLQEIHMMNLERIATEKGLQKGLQQGLQQGAHDKAVETAKNLFSRGLSLNQISSATGLSVEDLTTLQKEILKTHKKRI